MLIMEQSSTADFSMTGHTMSEPVSDCSRNLNLQAETKISRISGTWHQPQGDAMPNRSLAFTGYKTD